MKINEVNRVCVEFANGKHAVHFFDGPDNEGICKSMVIGSAGDIFQGVKVNGDAECDAATFQPFYDATVTSVAVMETMEEAIARESDEEEDDPEENFVELTVNLRGDEAMVEKLARIAEVLGIQWES